MGCWRGTEVTTGIGRDGPAMALGVAICGRLANMESWMPLEGPNLDANEGISPVAIGAERICWAEASTSGIFLVSSFGLGG